MENSCRSDHMITESHDNQTTHRWEHCGARERRVLSEDIVRAWSQNDEEVDDPTLRDPVSVSLRYLLLGLEIGEQLAKDVLGE